MTEKLDYKVLEVRDEFELRSYPEHILAQVSVYGDFINAGNRGFGPLLGYISGNNATGTKLAMTAPVIQEETGAGLHAVSFVLPKSTDPHRVPIPRNSHLSIVHMTPCIVAARRFSGSWKSERFNKERDALLASVLEAGLQAHGQPYSARYDPPWKPGFLKRNEVLVRVSPEE